MTAGGWFFMLVSVTGVTALFAWCIFRVLTAPECSTHLHATGETTPDVESPSRD